MMVRALKRVAKHILPKSIIGRLRIMWPSHNLAPEQDLIVQAIGLRAEWNLEEALRKADEALEYAPAMAKAIHTRATILKDMGKLDEACIEFKKFLELSPLNIGTIRNLESLGVSLDQFSVAQVEYILEEAVYSPSIALQAVNYLHYYERFEDALRFCDIAEAVISLRSSSSKRDINLGSLACTRALCLEHLNKFEDAIEIYRSVLHLRPVTAKAIVGIARCHLEMMQPRRAKQYALIATASRNMPQPFSPLVMDALQAAGDIEDAYALYRRRPMSSALRNHFGKEMEYPYFHDGSYRRKSVLLVSEGGPGDEFRHCSLYPEIRHHVGHLTITCEPRLETIMKRAFPEIDFLPVSRHRREIAKVMDDRRSINDPLLSMCISDDATAHGEKSDIVLSILDTLVEFRPSREAFRQNPRPLLLPLPRLKEEWRQQMVPGKLNIGLSWRSMLPSVARNRHYMTIDDLRPLTRIPHAVFWILQPGVTDDEIATLSEFADVRLAKGLDLIDDFEGQIALASTLDLIISPFTTTGEMGGALGVPTILTAVTGNTVWRRNPDGSDLWSKRTSVVLGNPLHDKKSAIEAAATIAADLSGKRTLTYG